MFAIASHVASIVSEPLVFVMGEQLLCACPTLPSGYIGCQWCLVVATRLHVSAEMTIAIYDARMEHAPSCHLTTLSVRVMYCRAHRPVTLSHVLRPCVILPIPVRSFLGLCVQPSVTQSNPSSSTFLMLRSHYTRSCINSRDRQWITVVLVCCGRSVLHDSRLPHALNARTHCLELFHHQKRIL